MNRLRQNEAGFTLVEMLLVCVLFIVVLSATLLTFNLFESNGAQEHRRLEQVETARRGLEHFARQARNLAKQASTGVSSINRAQAYDLIFQTSDPTRTWVRYCLQTTGPDASPTNGRLWMFENAAGLGGTGACTSAGWTKATVVAEHVVNASESRPVFSYLCAVGVSDCTSDAAVFERITGFHGDLAIDLDPARAPSAMRVSTGVYLRNQNQKPTAQFTVTPLGTQRVLLNGSASTDPEGRTLRFYWFKGSAPTFTCEVGPPAGRDLLGRRDALPQLHGGSWHRRAIHARRVRPRRPPVSPDTDSQGAHMIRIHPELRAEEGYAVAIALSVLSIMLVIGLAVLATVDTGSQRTREQRVRESALSLTEGALYSQGAVLARNWPSNLARSYLDSCTPATSTDPRCPSKDTLDASNSSQPAVAAFQSTDFLKDGNWQTWVRDNYGALATAYDPAKANMSLTGTMGTCAGPCKWDFNGDHAMWVQARAKVRDRYRNVVALLKLEELQESVARRAVVSGAVAITNNGNHGGTYMIDGSGSTVSVRCQPEPPGTHNATCTEYEAGQIRPRRSRPTRPTC